MLEHDSDGFLIADRNAIDDSENYLEQISDDIAEIKLLLTGMNSLSTSQATNNQESPLAEPNVINSETIRDNTERLISERNQQTTNDVTVDVQIEPIDINLSGQPTNEQARRNYRRDQSGRFIAGDGVTAEPVINNNIDSASSADESTINIDNQTSQVNAGATNSQINNSDVNNRASLINRTRDARGRFLSGDDVTAEPVINNQLSNSASINNQQEPLPNQQSQRLRGANGRFISDQNSNAGTGRRERDSRGRFVGGQSPSERQQERNLFGRLINAFSGRNGSINTDFQDVDPTIKAFNELKEIAQPLTNVAAGIGSAGKFALSAIRDRFSRSTSNRVNNQSSEPVSESQDSDSTQQSTRNSRSERLRNSASARRAAPRSNSSDVNQQSSTAEHAVNSGTSANQGDSNPHAQINNQQSNDAQRINHGQSNSQNNQLANREPIPVVIDSANIIEPIVRVSEQSIQQTKLFKLLFNDFKLFRKQDGIYQKTANKLLKDIAEQTSQNNSSESSSNGFLGGFLGGLTPMMLALLTSIVGSIVSVFAGLAPLLLSALGAVLTTVFSPIGLAIAAAATLAWGLFTEEGRAVFASIGGFIQEKFGQAMDWFAETFPETTQFIKDTWGNAVQLFDDAANYAKSVWDWLKERFTPIIDSATELWTWLKDKWDSTLALVSNVFDGIAGFIKNTFGFDIKAQAQKLLESTKKTVEKVVETGANLVKPVIEKTNELWQSTKETASNLIETAKTGVDNTSQAIERAYNVAAAKTGSALETVMPKGYRHKALFEGIKGGDALTKYGSYTDEEAGRIRHLKSNHANTSANINGGMPLDVQDKIAGQAKKYGLDPVMMQKIAAMESGGNADAISSTGAIGVYQFTGKTASGVGIKNRFDVNQNIEGGMKLAKANVEKLKSKGLPVTAENVYMMHQLGEGAAPEVIKAAMNGKAKSELSASTQSAMNLNFGATSKTAAEYIATNKKALDERYKKVVSNSIATLSNQKNNTDVVSPQQANAPSALAPTTQNALAQKSSLSNVLALSPQTISLSPAPFVSNIGNPKQVTTPKIPEAPAITIPLASNNDTTNTQTIIQHGDVGQDVSDRGIAHIITGGMAKKWG